MTAVVVCGLWPHASAETAGRLAGAALAPVNHEPDQIRAAWQARHGSEPLHVITAVAAESLLDGLTDDTALHSVDLHHGDADTRSVGELVARQIEQADTVVLAGDPGDDEWETEQLRALLRQIAPWSQHRDAATLEPPGPGRTAPLDPVTGGLSGRSPGVSRPMPDHGVTSLVFTALRPFHPERLHDALDEITDGVIRSRGHFWLASQPELVMTWESAATLSLGPNCGWLAELPGEHWHAVDPERLLAAEIDWNPYYGDRHQHLAFVGIDTDPQELHDTLTRCLLTDEELATGEQSWRRLPDPFTRSYPAGIGRPHHRGE